MAEKPKDETRPERFTDTTSDHVQVGPKTKKAMEKPKTKEELDALIPLEDEDEEEEDGK